jgi:hypothetical protein
LNLRLKASAGVFAVMVAGLLIPTAAGAATNDWGATFTPQTSGAFNFGSVAVGKTSSQVFTLTAGRWNWWSGRLTTAVSGSSAFTVSSDGCSGGFLAWRHRTCQVTVTYKPSASGASDTATLSASSTRWFWHHGWQRRPWLESSITLNGTSSGVSTTGGGGGGGGGGGTTSSGPANLQLSPGTLTASAGGTNSYSYDFGKVRTATTNFTVTNTGGTTSLELVLDGWSSGGYAVSNDTCSGDTLAAGASCTFSETWTSNNDPMCDAKGTVVAITPSVYTGYPFVTYVDANVSAACG